jgi:2-polyprenyl-3-methyl-5-hydroxy-6-metoxy-1,4-benzoquinol methylase
MSSAEGSHVNSDLAYQQALAGEGEFWDNYIAQQLLQGEMPASADRRLSLTHYRLNHGWRPICFGPRETNYRLREIHDLIVAASRQPGLRVLDLGCGAGWLSLELARRGAHVTGVDISPANLALARYMAETNTRNFPFLYPRFAGLPCRLEDFGSVEYVYGDLNTINLPLHEYDVIMVWDSLHHVAALERLLEQVRAALKPTGRFLGVDHAFATPRTEVFNLMAMSMLDDFYAWVTAENPEWFYRSTEALARQYDWGLLAVDYDPTPVPGVEAFFADLFAEMLAILHTGLRQEALDKARSQIGQPLPPPGVGEESPFEDVSAEQIIRLLAESFQATHFSTIGPYIMPERHIPHYRTEAERIFQHYLVAGLVVFGEHAIAKDDVDGQWFLFHLTPGRPTHPHPIVQRMIQYPRLEAAQVSQLVAERDRQQGALSERLAYIEHLEGELARKNAALTALEGRLRQQDQELLAARAPRLPWKRR